LDHPPGVTVLTAPICPLLLLLPVGFCRRGFRFSVLA